MKNYDIIIKLVLMSFTIAYCHFASEVLFSNTEVYDQAYLKKEYFQSLFVGILASLFAFGYILFKKKKER